MLVHGAWADGSSWDGVVSGLQRDGYTVSERVLDLWKFPTSAPVLLFRPAGRQSVGGGDGGIQDPFGVLARLQERGLIRHLGVSDIGLRQLRSDRDPQTGWTGAEQAELLAH